MPPTKVCTESVQSSYPVHQPKFARISQAFWAMKRSRKERQSARELKQNATEGILTIANNLCFSDTDLSRPSSWNMKTEISPQTFFAFLFLKFVVVSLFPQVCIFFS
ncbi:unnamed protein product [Calicophoron daubneyi]|uniref:Uncharacterized protein n=1 Tax=Calicophoron daubneyi TaxID=300641 RepID=A0AAV2SY18_CALDB